MKAAQMPDGYIQQAPARLVDQLVALIPPPRDPHLNPARVPAIHRGLCQRLADQIWAEAFHAGATYGLSTASAPRMILVDASGRQAHPERSQQIIDAAFAYDALIRSMHEQQQDLERSRAVIADLTATLARERAAHDTLLHRLKREPDAAR